MSSNEDRDMANSENDPVFNGDAEMRRGPAKDIESAVPPDDGSVDASGKIVVEKRGLSLGRKLALTTGVLALTVGLVGAAGATYWFAHNKLPDIRTLESYRPAEAIQIYDRFDQLIAVISGEEDRQVVPLAQISPEMRKAMMAAEDHDFYGHGGINPSSIARASLVNLQAGRVVEGGSTITQQLVKNLFFPGEPRTFNRKIKEFFLALEVSKKYPKDQILEMYLNQIYFGNQSYGVQRAAQRYFTKDAAHLTLAESAFLAGLVKAPSYLGVAQNRDSAIERQREVLDKMAEYGFVTQKQADGAKSQKLAFRKFVSPYQKYPHYIAYVNELLHQKYDALELQRGLKVYTNLDPAAQSHAEKTLDESIKKAPPGISQGALVSVRVNDGAVLALVGGVGKFEKHQWNRAVSPHTMGSSFKPFVYLSGFMKGLTPDSIVLDSPVSVPSGGHIYSPKNFDSVFKGPMTIRTALAQSRNVCAIRVAMFDGINNVIDTARMAGISSRLDPYLPIALGACAASPLEMAGAYSTFARGGVQMTPQVLRTVTTPEGKLLANFAPSPRKVFDSRPVSLLVDSMQTVVQKGTGLYAKLPDRPVAGKTGTSDQSRDIWFVGFTPDVCTAVWAGNDFNQRVHGKAVTGGMIMAAIWKKYMTGYYKDHPTPIAHFPAPSKERTQIASLSDTHSSGITLDSGTDESDKDYKEKLKKRKLDDKVASSTVTEWKGKQQSRGAASGRSRSLIARREAASEEADTVDAKPAESKSADAKPVETHEKFGGAITKFHSVDGAEEENTAPAAHEVKTEAPPHRYGVQQSPVDAPPANFHYRAFHRPAVVSPGGRVQESPEQQVPFRDVKPTTAPEEDDE